MLAYRLLQAQTQPEFQEVPEPHAGPGQVVVRVAGSGLCHTDFTVISRDRSYWKDEPPPFTLGHEIAGWVEELGTGVTSSSLATPSRSTRPGQAAVAVTCAGPVKRTTASIRRPFALPASATTEDTRHTSSSPRRGFSSPSATSTRSRPRRSRMRASRHTPPSSRRFLGSGRAAPRS